MRDRKGKAPPMGVEPDASHLPDEHPRPLDHRGFPNIYIYSIQVYLWYFQV